MNNTQPLPAAEFLKIPESGEPFLAGSKCRSCGAVFLGDRQICSRCGTRDQMESIHLANRGSLYSYSIVYRTFPGVEVPYISAIVDLEGGGSIKGNLIGVEPDPEKISFGMPVDVIYGDALGRKDQDGNAYLAYFFKPAS